MDEFDMDPPDNSIEMMNEDIRDALFHEGEKGISYLGRYGLSEIARYEVESHEDYLTLSTELIKDGYRLLGNFGDPRIFNRDATMLNDLKKTRDLVFTTAYGESGQRIDDMISVFAKIKEQ